MVKSVRKKNGVTIVKVEGALDATNVPQIKARLYGLIEDGCNRMVLDMGDLEFVDSTGLGMLVGCLRRCASREGNMCLVNVPEFPRSILELTRMTRIFHLAGSEEEAIDFVRHGLPQ